jgi:hypothetical protein
MTCTDMITINMHIHIHVFTHMDTDYHDVIYTCSNFSCNKVCRGKRSYVKGIFIFEQIIRFFVD